jgi:ribosomal protein L31E
VLSIFFLSPQNDDVKEDFSHLTPAQQKKKLGQKIDAIKSAISKETLERLVVLSRSVSQALWPNG